MSLLRTLRHLLLVVFARLPPRLQTMLRWRFVKFGIVGASGTVINIAVLYAAQEFLLVRLIPDFHMRLNFSIALAISIATVNNFYWNRRLTWKDRKDPTPQAKPEPVWRLFGKYVMAAGLSIALQSLMTRWLAMTMHYILANLLAIALASVCSFLANDRFTFRRKPGKKPLPAFDISADTEIAPLLPKEPR